MEAVFQCDDDVPLGAILVTGVFSRDFNGALVGLRAGVGEEHLLHSGFLAQELRQLRAGLGVVQIGHVLHLGDLLDDGLLPSIVRNAEAGHADAGAHVDVFLSVFVVHQAPLAGDNGDGEPVVGTGDEFLVHALNIHNLAPIPG